jgi:hypothetical protein
VVEGKVREKTEGRGQALKRDFWSASQGRQMGNPMCGRVEKWKWMEKEDFWDDRDREALPDRPKFKPPLMPEHELQDRMRLQFLFPGTSRRKHPWAELWCFINPLSQAWASSHSQGLETKTQSIHTNYKREGVFLQRFINWVMDAHFAENTRDRDFKSKIAFLIAEKHFLIKQRYMS